MNRRSLPWLLLAGILVVSSQAQKKSGAYERLLRPPGSTFYRMPIGLCEDYPEETTTLEIVRKDMELLKRSGIDLLRISFGWDAIEATKDSYTWLYWDDFVKMAVEEYGITLIPYVCYTPAWNSTGDTTNFWNHTPKDYEEFGQFVHDLVLRYKPWIRTWELWNEPDIDSYWSGDVRDFARLAKIGSEAVRKADPKAIVVLGGLAHDVNFMRSLFRDLGISPYVDVVNIHNYNETWSGTPNEQIMDYVYSIADIIQTWGRGQSLWVAEVGYSTFRRGGRVSDSYSATYDYEHTPAYQAVHLVRTLTMLLVTEKVAAVAWYEVKDLTSKEDVIGDDNNRHLGVATLHHEAKPAEHALAFFNRLTSRKLRSLDRSVLVTKSAGSDAEVHAFESEDGSVIVVGWLRTHVRGRRTSDIGGSARDDRKETVEVSLSKGVKGAVQAYNEVGTKIPAPRVIRGSKETTVHMDLAGGGVTILQISR